MGTGAVLLCDTLSFYILQVLPLSISVTLLLVLFLQDHLQEHTFKTLKRKSGIRKVLRRISYR